MIPQRRHRDCLASDLRWVGRVDSPDQLPHENGIPAPKALAAHRPRAGFMQCPHNGRCGTYGECSNRKCFSIRVLRRGDSSEILQRRREASQNSRHNARRCLGTEVAVKIQNSLMPSFVGGPLVRSLHCPLIRGEHEFPRRIKESTNTLGVPGRRPAAVDPLAARHVARSKEE